jgi:hypothetical protein
MFRRRKSPLNDLLRSPSVAPPQHRDDAVSRLQLVGLKLCRGALNATYAHES